MTVQGYSVSYGGQHLQIAIVGRGFSGLMMAIALMKSVSQPFQLRMFDPRPVISGGQALATAGATEILNSRARDLSVSTGEPKDFTRWLQAYRHFRDAVSAAIPGFGQIFVPKAIFSDYVYQRFSEALAERTDVSIQMSHEAITSIRRNETGRFTLGLADGSFPSQPMPSQLRHIVRFVRKACAQAEENGWSWQAAMNGLRKRARTLWASLPPSEKRQFNRHLRAIYDSHRNRLPADVHERLERELASGMTELKRGTTLKRSPAGLIVRWAGQSTEEHFAADEVIDCRCLSPDLKDPVIADLLRAGLASPDELDLGLAVNPAGELLTSWGRSAGLFAIGPLGLGSLPDIDLVPEIVTQTYTAATLINARSRPQLQAG